MPIKLSWAPAPKLLSAAQLDKVIATAIKSQIRINVEQKVPFRSGDTYSSSSASYSQDDNSIVYETSYAASIYENKKGVTFQTTHHSQATDHWHEKDFEQHQTQYINLAEKAVVREW